MKNCLLQISIYCLVFFLTSQIVLAKSADDYFANKEYQAALEAYEKETASFTTDLKKIECLLLLKRFKIATEKFKKIAVPQASFDKIMYLIFKAETQALAMRYGVWQGQETLESIYTELLQSEATLRKTSIDKLTGFIALNEVEDLPTVYDLIIDRIKSNNAIYDTKKISEIYKIASTGSEPKRSYVKEKWLGEYLALNIRREYKAEEQINIINEDDLKSIKAAFIKAETLKGKADLGYLLGSLYFENLRYAEAFDICDQVEKTKVKSVKVKNCLGILQQITKKELSFESSTVSVNSKKVVHFRSRNIDTIYYKVFADLRPAHDLMEKNYLGLEEAQNLLKGKELKLGQIQQKPKEKYLEFEGDLDFPGLEPGFYYFMASSGPDFKNGSDKMSVVQFHLTDLSVIAFDALESNLQQIDKAKKTLNLPYIHFYPVNLVTGKLEKNVTYEGTFAEQVFSTEKNILNADINYTFYQNFNLSGVAKKNNQVALFRTSPAVQILQIGQVSFLFDRPIYRPGQKVQLKIQAFIRDGLNKKLAQNEEFTLTIKDANWLEVLSQKLKLNNFGSAVFTFDVPLGKTLGDFQVEVKSKAYFISQADSNLLFQGQASFKVEEYKRPDYFIQIEPQLKNWTPGILQKIKGHVYYYSGQPVQGANVKYILSGLTKTMLTDKKGEFSLEFTPPKLTADSVNSFNLTVEARDTSGRVVTDSKYFYVAKTEFDLNVVAQNDFYDTGAIKLQAWLQDAALNKFNGLVKYEIYKLGDPVYKKEFSFSRTRHNNGFYNGYDESHLWSNDNLQSIYRDTPNGDFYKKGQFKIDTSSTQQENLNVLIENEGIYRIHSYLKDAAGVDVKNDLIICVVNDLKVLSKINLPGLILVEKKNYKIGDTIRALIGKPNNFGDLFIHVTQGNFLIDKKIINNDLGLKLIDFTASDFYAQGVTLSWFEVFKDQFITKTKGIFVEEKKLKLALSADSKKIVGPGEKQQIQFLIKNSNQQNVTGELSLRVYDASLEAYHKDQFKFYDELYPHKDSNYLSLNFSKINYGTLNIAESENNYVEMMKKFDVSLKIKFQPTLYINTHELNDNHYEKSSINRPMGFSESAANFSLSDASLDVASPAQVFSAKSARSQQTDNQTEQKKSSVAKDTQALDNVKLRSNFSETGYFNPGVSFKNGKAEVSFASPEQLTNWRVQAVAVTSKGYLGEYEGEFKTQKDFSLKAQLPRFWREGDLTDLNILINNQSPISGDVNLSVRILKNNKNIIADFTIDKMNYKIKIDAKAQLTQTLKLKIPDQIGIYQVEVKAQLKNLSDGEVQDISILPSRQRLIESRILALNGTLKKTLNLPSAQTVDLSRINESMVLQIEPQTALNLLQSIPYLVDYPFSCTEQLMNKWVPTAIMAKLFENNPDLALALYKIPKRKTALPDFKIDDSRRLMEVSESPWLSQFKQTESAVLLNLLDSDKIKSSKEESFSDLLKRQNPSGGFAWFPGGQDDLYITLVVLDGFSQAVKYKVNIPNEVIDRALKYLETEIPKHLKVETRELSFVLYASYIMTSFDQVKFNKILISKWMQYVDKYNDRLLPLGFAYGAWAYSALNESKKMNQYLDRAMDNSRTEDLIGTYWQPEAESWLWYHDTVEKHAFFLRTLMKFRAQDPKITGMVQWLLTNKKGNTWRSTKTTAAVVYSLMDYFSQSKVLKAEDKYQIKWGNLNKDFIINNSDYIASPIRFEKNNPQDLPQDVVIDKKGPGLAFATETWIYSSSKIADAVKSDLIGLDRKFYHVSAEGLKKSEIRLNDTVKVGELIIEEIIINTRTQLEYVHLKDPRGSGFEDAEKLSGYRWDSLARFEEVRDSLTNSFINWLPHGEYKFERKMRATLPGQYKIQSAVIQSMYAPEIVAYSSGFEIKVE